MKMKTIEQKAKAYDEALKYAKSALDCLADDYICSHLTKDDIRGMYAKFFPELGGNEDEKIRKSLLVYFAKFKSSDMWDADFSFGDIVAWIEKQGSQILANSCKTCKDEQKPSWSEEDEKQARQIERIVHDDGCTQKLQKQIADWLKSLKGRVQPKQDWSQNDIDMIGWLIRCCEKEHEELCNDKYGHQDIVSDLKRDCRKKWDWLESLKNRVAPQKQ